MGKSKYETAIVPNMNFISALIRDGWSIKEIAKKIGVAENSITTYRKQHKEFDELFAVNRERVDLEHVVGAYFRLATGYTVRETTKHYKFDENGNRILADEYVKEKYIPPNPNCTENWIRARLKNDKVWGTFAADTKKTIVAETENEEGGVVYLPPKRKAEDEKIIEVKVNEVTHE